MDGFAFLYPEFLIKVQIWSRNQTKLRFVYFSNKNEFLLILSPSLFQQISTLKFLKKKENIKEEEDRNEIAVVKNEEKMKEDKPEDKKGKLLEHLFKELGSNQDKKKIKDYLNFLIKGGDLNNLKENLKKKLKQE